jgi:hypothetical protein
LPLKDFPFTPPKVSGAALSYQRAWSSNLNNLCNGNSAAVKNSVRRKPGDSLPHNSLQFFENMNATEERTASEEMTNTENAFSCLVSKQYDD